MKVSLKDILGVLLLFLMFLGILWLGGYIASEDQARAAIAPVSSNLVNNQTSAPGPMRLPGKE